MTRERIRARPRIAPWVAAACALATVALAAPGAEAQTAKLAAAQSSRPLTLPRATLRFDGGPRWPMPGGQLELYAGDGDEAMLVNLGLGAGFTDRFEAGILALPLRIVPDADVRNPVLYMLYGLSGGAAQVGVFASMVLPVEGSLELTAGFPLRVRLGHVARLDLAALLRLDVDPTRVHLWLPFELAFDVGSRFFLGPEVGLFLWEMDDAAVPIGFFLGPTFVRGSRVIGDLRIGVRETDITNQFDVLMIYMRAELFFDV